MVPPYACFNEVHAGTSILVTTLFSEIYTRARHVRGRFLYDFGYEDLPLRHLIKVLGFPVRMTQTLSSSGRKAAVKDSVTAAGVQKQY